MNSDVPCGLPAIGGQWNNLLLMSGGERGDPGGWGAGGYGICMSLTASLYCT